jgi:hypothetical protein
VSAGHVEDRPPQPLAKARELSTLHAAICLAAQSLKLLTVAARMHDLGAMVHKPLKARKEYGGNFGNRLLTF